MTHPAHPTHLARIVLWLLLALVLAGLAVIIDGCHRPVIFHAPVIGRPLPVPHVKVGRR